MNHTSVIQRIYSKEEYRIAFSLILTLVLFKLTSFFAPHMFFINDDENIMYTLSGYYTYGKPFDHYFVNFCLSFFLRLLYSVMPFVQWYGVFHVTVLIVSVALVFKTTMRYCYRQGIPFIVSLLMNLTLYYGIFVFPSILMQFTTTAAFAGAAACVLLFGIDLRYDSKHLILMDSALSILMLLLSYMHRKNTGMIIFCFYFGTAVYHFAKHYFSRRRFKRTFRLKSLKRLGAIVLSCVILLGAVTFINKVARSNEEWKTYLEYEDARFRVTDYPHDSYDDNPELYKSIHWPKELYNLAGKSWWFFMDPRINVPAFRKIAVTGFYDKTRHTIQAAIQVAYNLWSNEPIARILIRIFSIGLFIVICFLVVCTEEFRRKRWEYLYGLCILLGTLVLCCVLCYRQRLPLRAFHAITLPFVSLWAVLILRLIPTKKEIGWSSKARTLVSIGLVIVILISGLINISEAKKLTDTKRAQTAHTLSVEQYVMDHQDQLFVYDVSLTFRYEPFTVYRGKYPSNLMFWGGMGYRSPAFHDQLAANGLDTLYSNELLKDNIYYITRDSFVASDLTMRDRLERYMDVTYGDCDFIKLEDHEDSFSVYKIVLKDKY